MQRKIPTLILLITCFMCFNCRAMQNFISNGGFESYQDGKPADWNLKVAEPSALSLDSNDPASGKFSLKISHHDSNSSSWALQEIEVIPHSTYVVTAFIKTSGIKKGIDAKGPRLFIGDQKGKALATEDVPSNITNWQDFKIEFSTGENNKILIVAQLHKTIGVVWFDDLIMTLQSTSEDNLQRNLLPDGSFEEWDMDELVRWRQRGRDASVTCDKEHKVDGSCSIRITNIDDTEYNYVEQHGIKLKPNTDYIITGRIKGENIVKKGFGARLYTNIKSSTGYSGTFDWEEIRIEFNSGNETSLSIVPYLHQSSGTVWFDDIKLTIKSISQMQQSLVQANLLANGNFEEWDKDKLVHWSPGSRKGSITRSEINKANGRYSVKITNLDDTEYNYVAQHGIKLKPNTDYIITGWVKGENIIQKGFGARLYTNIKSSTGYSGTFEWEEIRIEFNSGSETSLSIVPYLHQSSGTVWFDDIILIDKSIFQMQQSLVQTNLLTNGSFEEWDKDKLVQWSSGCREGSITRSEIDKINGRYSVKITNLDDTEYNYVAQHGIKLKPNTDYIITGWVKGANIVQKGFGARLYTNIKSSTGYSGTFDWEEIRIEFNSGSETSLSIVPYLHQSSGTVWFDDIQVYEQKISLEDRRPGIQLSLGGTVDSLVYYSPKSGFKTDNSLRISNSINISDFISARFYIFTLYESANVGFEQKPKRQFNPWLDFLTITIKGPLFPSSSPVTLVLGQSWLSYSPYVAYINYDYAVKGQGITLDDVHWGKFNLNGFLIFERKRPYQDIGEGIRIRTSEGPWKGEVILVRHLNGNPIVDQNGRIVSLAKYELLENTLLLEGNRQFGKGQQLNILRIEQRNYGKENTLATAQKVDYSFPIKSSTIKVSYRNFKPGFEPRYCSKTPRYSLSDKTLLGWNPVDRYKNQRGFSVDVKTRFVGIPTDLEIDCYKLLPELINTRTNIFLSLAGENRYNIISTFEEYEKSLSYFEVMIQRQLVRGNWGTLSGHIRHIYDRTGRNNTLNAKGALQEYMLETSFNRGGLSGLKLAAGALRAKENHLFLRGQWTLLGNIQFAFSHSVPRITTVEDYWFDDYNRLYCGYNYVSLQSKISF